VILLATVSTNGRQWCTSGIYFAMRCGAAWARCRTQKMRRAFESRLSQGEFQAARQSPHASARQITTERMVAMELEIVQTMRAGQGQASRVLSHFAASRVAERQPHLNPAQQTSIEQVLTSPDRIQAIQGYAGVGKSTALSAIQEGAVGGLRRRRICPDFKGRAATPRRRYLCHDVTEIPRARRPGTGRWRSCRRASL
jgi:hypothetical protein